MRLRVFALKLMDYKNYQKPPHEITAITSILSDGGAHIFVFVKAETDQPGLVG